MYNNKVWKRGAFMGKDNNNENENKELIKKLRKTRREGGRPSLPSLSFF